MRLLYFTLCIALLALCGCEKDVQSIEKDEEKHPLIQEGQAYIDTKNWDQAEQSFKAAISSNDRMAKPHLELANIYHQHKAPASVDNYEFYIEAIYHYKRYLELRPNTEKRTFIVEQIDDARTKWARAVYTISGISKQIQEANRRITTLSQQNQQLSTSNAQLKKQLAALQQNTTPSTQVAQQKTETKTAPVDNKPTTQTTTPTKKEQEYMARQGNKEESKVVRI